MKCKTCKHWEKPEDTCIEVPGMGRCEAVEQYDSVITWRDGVGKRELKPEYAAKLAFVQDISDEYAELKTMADFGCIQYEDMTPNCVAPKENMLEDEKIQEQIDEIKRQSQLLCKQKITEREIQDRIDKAVQAELERCAKIAISYESWSIEDPANAIAAAIRGCSQ